MRPEENPVMLSPKVHSRLIWRMASRAPAYKICSEHTLELCRSRNVTDMPLGQSDTDHQNGIAVLIKGGE